MADKERIKDLLSETIILLCKNGLNFDSEFSIEGLIGITVDKKDVFLVSLKETICLANSVEETLQRKSPGSKNSVENADNSGGSGQTQNSKTISNKTNSSGGSDQSTRRRKQSCDASTSEIDSENTSCKRSRASNVEVKLESDKRGDPGETTGRKNQESNKIKDVDVQAMEMVNSIELFATLSKQSEHQHGQTTSTNVPFDDVNPKVEGNNQIGEVIKIESISDEDSSEGREQFESDWPAEMFSSSFAATSDDAAHSSFPTNSFSSSKVGLYIFFR